MDVYQLWSAHPVVGIVAIVILVVCCGCCCCSPDRTPRKSIYRHGNWGAPSSLESGLLIQNGFELTKGDYERVATVDSESETDVPEEYPNFPAPTVNSVNRERSVTQLPHHFNDFIVDKIIPYFLDQRRKDYQFAVVVLLSESDFDNVCQTSFIPSDSGKPILDKSFSIMPQDRADYGNYIVATPISNSYHSEEMIFGQYSVIDSPFSHLWSAYVEHTGAYPKCIFLYSWNLPCSRCTDVIIRSLGEEPYKRVSVIVAHTQVWKWSESESQHKMNTEKLKCEKITVEQVPYPVHLPPA